MRPSQDSRTRRSTTGGSGLSCWCSTSSAPKRTRCRCRCTPGQSRVRRCCRRRWPCRRRRAWRWRSSGWSSAASSRRASPRRHRTPVLCSRSHTASSGCSSCCLRESGVASDGDRTLDSHILCKRQQEFDERPADGAMRAIRYRTVTAEPTSGAGELRHSIRRSADVHDSTAPSRRHADDLAHGNRRRTQPLTPVGALSRAKRATHLQSRASAARDGQRGQRQARPGPHSAQSRPERRGKRLLRREKARKAPPSLLPHWANTSMRPLFTGRQSVIRPSPSRASRNEAQARRVERVDVRAERLAAAQPRARA